LIGFNSLLIRGQGRTILIDPGTGDKMLSEAFREYRLEWPRKVFAGLADLGVSLASIDTVILTHLHWDHCGAATRMDDAGVLRPTFPHARYTVHSKELAAARVAIGLGNDGYLAEDFEPLAEAGVLDVLEEDIELAPGVRVEWVGGHSAGLQIVEIGGPEKFAIFLSDLVPTAAQLPLDSVMSYDEHVDELTRSKRRVLERAVARRDLLLFVHGPSTRAGYVKSNAAGEYEFERTVV
jgi:glyoxylase-like metal-dependent hydrolase (beta-lactamase superfamily II)